MKKVSFLHAIIFLVIGAFLGNFIYPRLSNKAHQPEIPTEDNWKDKLQALTDGDIADFYRLKTLEERYKKADEILGKITTVFLADLGIRASKTTLAQAKQRISALPKQDQLSQTQKPPEPASRAENALKTLEKPKMEKWISTEKLREEIRNEREIPDFLEKVKIANLDEALKSSSAYRNKTNTLDVLKGHFLGTAEVGSARKFVSGAVFNESKFPKLIQFHFVSDHSNFVIVLNRQELSANYTQVLVL